MYIEHKTESYSEFVELTLYYIGITKWGKRRPHFIEQSDRGTLLLLCVEQNVPRTFVEQSERVNMLIYIVEHPWNTAQRNVIKCAIGLRAFTIFVIH